MPTCPRCGATVPEGAVYCGNCGATLNTAGASTSTQTTQSQSTTWPTSTGVDLQTKYERLLKRTEQLSYAAAGLGIAILVVILVISFL